MALAIKDRVKETTTTTGTGTYTLGGAVTGFETFTANLSNSDTTYYACTDNTNFEVGIGTFTSSGTTLARTTILSSSNSNSAVNWSSGTRTIFMTYPADKAVFKDASNNINGTFVGNITGNVTGNTSGTAATVTGAAQTNITSLGTLTALTVDNVAINATTIGHTDDTDLITLADGVVTVAGELDATTLDISGNADIDGTLEADAITVDGTALATYIRGTVGTNMLSSNTESGITVTYDTTNDNIDFSVDAAQTGITSLLATDIKIGEDDQTKIDFETADTINFYAGNEKQLVLTDGALTPGTNAIVDLGTDALEFKDAYFDGTVEADAITIGGTALNTVIAGVTVTNATNSAHVLVTDNESTNEENLITFVEGATSSTGNVGLEMDGHLTYNPSSGTVTATIFKGNIDAVDGDFDGTLEADAITVNGATLNSVIADEATALAIALG